VQPPLTKADELSMSLQALQNRRRPEQHVEVTFDQHGDDHKDQDKDNGQEKEAKPEPAQDPAPHP
jgi:hypothetical protein